MDQKRLDILLGEGKRSLQKSNLLDAKKSYQEVIEIDPTNVEAFFSLANIFHLEGQIAKSIKGFRKVLELDPGHTDAAISLSVLLNDIGKYEEAKKIFNQVNENVKSKESGVDDDHINRKFAVKHYELAEMYLLYQRYEEALREYEKAIALDSSNLELRVKVAKLYSKKGFVNKAVDELKRLKAEHPYFLDGRVALGLLLYGNGNVVEAETEWLAVLKKDPHHPQVKKYLNLAEGATETKVF